MPVIKNPQIRERNSFRIYGCSEAEAVRWNGGMALRTAGCVAARYTHQRTAAFKRGVGWEITFPEWMTIWQQSGHMGLRGVGIGCYCMARNQDVGPYKIGNVSIQLCTTNSRDGLEIARPSIPSRIGEGRGWTYREGVANPYQVVCKKKYIGAFRSVALAEAAYRDEVNRHLASVS